MLPLILNSRAPKGCTISCKSLCSRLQCARWRNCRHFFVLGKWVLHQLNSNSAIDQTHKGMLYSRGSRRPSKYLIYLSAQTEVTVFVHRKQVITYSSSFNIKCGSNCCDSTYKHSGFGTYRESQCVGCVSVCSLERITGVMKSGLHKAVKIQRVSTYSVLATRCCRNSCEYNKQYSRFV